TTFPRYSESECVLPSASVSCQSGAVSPTFRSFMLSWCEDGGRGATIMGPWATEIDPEPDRATKIRMKRSLLMFFSSLFFDNSPSSTGLLRNDASSRRGSCSRQTLHRHQGCRQGCLTHSSCDCVPPQSALL